MTTTATSTVTSRMDRVGLRVLHAANIKHSTKQNENSNITKLRRKKQSWTIENIQPHTPVCMVLYNRACAYWTFKSVSMALNLGAHNKRAYSHVWIWWYFCWKWFKQSTTIDMARWFHTQTHIGQIEWEVDVYECARACARVFVFLPYAVLCIRHAYDKRWANVCEFFFYIFENEWRALSKRFIDVLICVHARTHTYMLKYESKHERIHEKMHTITMNKNSTNT